MIVGYIRISTSKQDLDTQKLAILDYCNRNNLKINKWIEVTSSSRKSTRKRKIDSLLKELQKGDVLIVAELSRLGRSLPEVIRLTDELVKKGVALHSLKESIHLNGRKDIQTKVMISMFSLLAELERDLISERTKEGLRRARSQGKLIGRPRGPGKSKLDPHKDEIIKLLKMKVPKKVIAEKFGVTPQNLHTYLKKRGLLGSQMAHNRS